MKFEFLGTSDTGGIPLHLCACAICEAARKKGTTNRSTCAYLELDDGSIILFDTGFDTLMDRFNTTPIRAVFLTHFHADHCLGLIRLRKSVSTIPCYTPNDENGFGDLLVHKDSIRYHAMAPFETQVIQNVSITAVPLQHSKPTMGYVVTTPKSSVAYLTDAGGIDDDVVEFLKARNIEHLFLDACYQPQFESKKHFNWESAEAMMKRISPKNGYFIHASCKTLLPLHEQGLHLEYPYIEQGFMVEV